MTFLYRYNVQNLCTNNVHTCTVILAKQVSIIHVRILIELVYKLNITLTEMNWVYMYMDTHVHVTSLGHSNFITWFKDF